LVSLDSPLLWIAATLHVEWATRHYASASSLAAIGGVVSGLARNPIVMAVVLGTLWRLGGPGMPEIPDKFLALLGQAAVPSGLFALGMSLAGYEFRGQAPTLAAICLMKMLLLPVLVYVLAAKLLSVPSLWVSVAVLFAAMPVGANAFLFAAMYERAVGSVSGAIAMSTAAAVVTISIVLYLQGAR
jgi:predicted permease